MTGGRIWQCKDSCLTPISRHVSLLCSKKVEKISCLNRFHNVCFSPCCCFLQLFLNLFECLDSFLNNDHAGCSSKRHHLNLLQIRLHEVETQSQKTISRCQWTLTCLLQYQEEHCPVTLFYHHVTGLWFSAGGTAHL